MTDLKLAKLPDRTPVKLMLNITPDLQHALDAYAAIYAETYGHQAAVADLVPGMITAFLESDRGFQRQVASKAKAKS